MKRLFLILSFIVFSCVGVWGQVTLSKWTFESATISGTNSTTPTIVPSTADVGALTTGSAVSGLHASNSTDWSSVTGNGSSVALFSNTWAIGDYYQFLFKTTSYSSIKLTWDATGSNTGPRDFKVQYSTDGVSFTDATGTNSTYTLTNDGWSSGSYISASTRTLDLSYATALNNQATVYIRLVVTSTTSINGSTVATGGTSRVDDFKVEGTFTGSIINFYSKSTGNLTDVATWGTNTDGSGTQPGDFITDAQIFNVVNRASTTLDANWTVSGTASKVIVGDGLSPTTLILPATAALTGTADVSSISTLQIVNTTLPSFGNLAINSTVDYAQTASPYVVPTGTTYHHLKLTGNTKTFASGTVSVNGNMIVDGVTDFNGSGTSPYTIMALGGNFSLVNSSTFESNPAGDANRMTVTCNGTGTQTFSGGDFYLFRVQTPAAGTVTIALNAANLSLGNLNGGGLTLLQAAHTLSIGAGNTLTFHGAGYISGTNVGFLSGTATSNLVFDKTQGTLPPGTLQFASGGQLLNNLSYNCTAPAGNTTLNLATPVVLSGNLTMTSGNIDIGTNDISVTGASTGSATSYIKTSSTGLLKLLNVTGLRNAPIGESTYNPITVTSTDGYDWSTRVEDVLGIDDPVFQPNATGAVTRQWYAYPSTIPPASNAVVTFQYNDGDVTQIGTTFDPNKLVQVWRKINNGSPWGADWIAVNTTQAPTGTPGSDRTATTSNWNIFSNMPFAVSNLDAPLPLQCILTLKAEKRNNTGFITWDVNSCAGVGSFELQRSVNGGAYQTIQTVRPSNNELSFTYTDFQTAKGRNLYRIRVNGLQNGYQYSKVAALVFDSNEMLITSVWPNPVTDVLHFTLSAARQQSVSLAIYNSLGTIVKKWNTTTGDGNTTIETNVSALPAGVYHIIAVSGSAKANVVFVK